jgi:hypothetical protein
MLLAGKLRTKVCIHHAPVSLEGEAGSSLHRAIREGALTNESPQIRYS